MLQSRASSIDEARLSCSCRNYITTQLRAFYSGCFASSRLPFQIASSMFTPDAGWPGIQKDTGPEAAVRRRRHPKVRPQRSTVPG